MFVNYLNVYEMIFTYLKLFQCIIRKAFCLTVYIQLLCITKKTLTLSQEEVPSLLMLMTSQGLNISPDLHFELL